MGDTGKEGTIREELLKECDWERTVGRQRFENTDWEQRAGQTNKGQEMGDNGWKATATGRGHFRDDDGKRILIAHSSEHTSL